MTGQPDRPHRNSCWFGKRRRLERQPIVNHGQISIRNAELFGKGALIAHTNQFAVCTQVVVTSIAGLALQTGYKRVDCHPPTRQRTGADNTNSLMAKDKRRYAAVIMAMPGMHVGPADAAERNVDKAFATPGNRHIKVADLGLLRARIDKCLHETASPRNKAAR